MNKKLEEFNSYAKDKKIAVIGIGISNIPLLEYFTELGAQVTVFDKRIIDDIEKNITEKFMNLGVKYSLGENYLSKLVGFDMIFRSPSCRPDLPEILAEVKRGAILTSEIEMLIELANCTIIGVTGSDGKTTTTTLIYEMLKEKGYDTYLGGNIGIPLFIKLKNIKEDSIIVLELSSFQLMTMKVSPNISVITNISPNHLDIHKTYEEYIEAKKNIFIHQSKEDMLILNYDNEVTNSFTEEAKGKVLFFSSKEKINDGVVLDEAIIKSCENKLRKHIINTKDVILRGKHNHENICAAICTTKHLVDIETIKTVITSFRGVPHRLELVREIEGVKFYNDSIGTSPSRTSAGLNSFSEDIILIAGGYDKHLDYTEFGKQIVDSNKIKSLILMGQTADKIFEAVHIELENQNKEIDIYECETLEQTVRIAKGIAKAGEIVLFSPASASFDMFKNFEERGNKFKEIVNGL